MKRISHKFFICMFVLLVSSFTTHVFAERLDLIKIVAEDGGSPFSMRAISSKEIELAVSVYAECNQEYVEILAHRVALKNRGTVKYEIRVVAKNNGLKCKEKGIFEVKTVKLPLVIEPEYQFIAKD